MSSAAALISLSPAALPASPSDSWSTAVVIDASASSSVEMPPSRSVRPSIMAANWSPMMPACPLSVASSGTVSAGRLADCTILTPGIAMI
jgi:hypothetical protein